MCCWFIQSIAMNCFFIQCLSLFIVIGNHITLVSHSRFVQFCLLAAEELAGQGIECEVSHTYKTYSCGRWLWLLWKVVSFGTWISDVCACWVCVYVIPLPVHSLSSVDSVIMCVRVFLSLERDRQIRTLFLNSYNQWEKFNNLSSHCIFWIMVNRKLLLAWWDGVCPPRFISKLARNGFLLKLSSQIFQNNRSC